MRPLPLPSYKLIRELFDYASDTGILSWRMSRGRNKIKAGDVAGCLNQSGYLQVCIDYKLYLVHRIIWVWVTGEEPQSFIDHKDTVKSNNRWLNLREATNSQNQANAGLSRGNTSGYKGVSWCKANQRWVAAIQKDGKTYWLGQFDTAAAAHAVHVAKAAELYGEFARVA